MWPLVYWIVCDQLFANWILHLWAGADQDHWDFLPPKKLSKEDLRLAFIPIWCWYMCLSLVISPKPRNSSLPLCFDGGVSRRGRNDGRPASISLFIIPMRNLRLMKCILNCGIDITNQAKSKCDDHAAWHQGSVRRVVRTPPHAFKPASYLPYGSWQLTPARRQSNSQPMKHWTIKYSPYLFSQVYQASGVKSDEQNSSAEERFHAACTCNRR